MLKIAWGVFLCKLVKTGKCGKMDYKGRVA
jgi:hypothetical protein